MKKIFIFSALALSVALLLGVICISADSEKKGVTFSADTYYKAETPFSEPIISFEAWVKVPNSLISGASTCIIISNDWGYEEEYIGFGINKRGIPHIYMRGDDGGNMVVFKEANVRTGEWEHFAIVINNADMEAYCYVNGELASTKKMTAAAGKIYERSHFIGNDGNSGKPNWFKGELGSVTLYSDMRTADEIAADYAATSPDTDSLIAYYNFFEETEKSVSDGVSGKYDMRFIDQWLRDKEYLSADEYDYAFAVVGDTQKITGYNPSYFHVIYDWLVEHLDERKIKLVMGMGDITENDTAREWELAVEHISKLDEKVRYTLVPGNHDSNESLDKYFPYEKYAEFVGGSYEEGSMANSWQEIILNDLKYLILCLEYNPNKDILAWAGQVCADHPDHNVIITTHSYMDVNGERNSHGKKIWNNLASLYENVILVLSGHEHIDPIMVKRSEGVNGNIVTQMLINPQSIDEFNTPSGMVALFYFSDGGRKLTVEYISTIADMHYTEESQFTIDIPVVGAPVPIIETYPSSPSALVYVLTVSVAAVIILVVILLSVRKKRSER